MLETPLDLQKAGPVVFTATVHEAINADGPEVALSRHANIIARLTLFCLGHWGNTCPEDAELNTEAAKLADGSRILATYDIDWPGHDTLWICADAYGGGPEMEPHVIILFPEDY